MKMKRTPSGYIYFVEFVWSGFIKIGWSTNIYNRLRTLRKEFGPVELLSFYTGRKYKERLEHVKFFHLATETDIKARKGKFCEIFFPGDDLVNYIDKLNTNAEHVRKVNVWLKGELKLRRGTLPRNDVWQIRNAYAGDQDLDKICVAYRISMPVLVRILTGRTYSDCGGPIFTREWIAERTDTIFYY